MKNKEKEIIFEGITLFLFIVLFGASIYSFQVGSHNVDLGQNMRYLECEFDTKFIDRATNLKYYTPEEIYIEGQKQMGRGFYLGMFSTCGIGFILFDLFKKKKGEKCST